MQAALSQHPQIRIPQHLQIASSTEGEIEATTLGLRDKLVAHIRGSRCLLQLDTLTRHQAALERRA